MAVFANYNESHAASQEAASLHSRSEAAGVISKLEGALSEAETVARRERKHRAMARSRVTLESTRVSRVSARALAIEELGRLRRSAVNVLWALYSLHLKGQGVTFDGLVLILGIHTRPRISIAELYREKLIVNLSPHRAMRARLVLTPKAIALMERVCSMD